MRCRRALIPTHVIVLVVVLSLLASGCGGGGSPGVASVSSSTTAATATTQKGALAYARCMRSHGVAGFPDPDSSGEIPKQEVVPLVGGAHFQAAQGACQRLLPDGGQPSQAELARHLGDLLAFARCMRAHGIPSFPDPTSSGQVTHEMLAEAGVDVHQQAVLQAADACVRVTHGVLTRAAVARFAAGR